MKATSVALSVSALIAGVSADIRNFTTLQPTGTFNPAAATAVQTEYPKDHHIVKGRFVDHLWHVVLDSADYDDAAGNSDLQALEKYGLRLTNYYAVSHPPQANYLAMIGGDTFGLESERFVAIPKNVSTLVESFEAARVLWAQYTEDQPFTAYDGWQYPAENPTYSRAKNPFIAFDSIAGSQKRYVNLRSLATLQSDLQAHRFPQWLFIRPNLNNDGTNSDLATAAKWARDFLEPYVSNKKHYHRKLYLLTFANTKSTTGPNRVYTLLLGDVPKKFKGKTDDTYYDHYSIAATAIANYDLPSLGRFDCGANVFKIVNRKSKMPTKKVDITDNYNQGPDAGFLSSTDSQMPVPNLTCRGQGRVGVLKRVRKTWKKASYSYQDWNRAY